MGHYTWTIIYLVHFILLLGLFGGQRTICESKFFLRIIYVPGIELRLLSLAASWLVAGSRTHFWAEWLVLYLLPCSVCAWVPGLGVCLASVVLPWACPKLTWEHCDPSFAPATAQLHSVHSKCSPRPAPSWCAKRTGRKWFTHLNCVTCWQETVQYCWPGLY